MESRRDFLKKAVLLSGAVAGWSIPESIRRAMTIDPETGSTYLDAEHVVILMQENRAFDHAYGALQGVRGFRDPRAHTLPDGNPVWFQTDAHGATYAPFRLDIKETNATWIGGLPHNWNDQVDATNGGRHDQWLVAKAHAHLPFTLGHYRRDDVAFYYALADAFTICDQAFCSSLTGTTPNRLFLWTGTIRKDAADKPRVLNSETDYGAEANWTTFPERLEEAGVSWRIYQNELDLESGFTDEEDEWLGNFDDNPIEWFTQYNVRFAKSHRTHIDHLLATLPAEIEEKQGRAKAGTLGDAKKKSLDKEISAAVKQLADAKAEKSRWTEAAWDALSPTARALHEKAFTVNTGDPSFRELEPLQYDDSGTQREMRVPKGDILYQLRRDVADGQLPAVSWVVAPCNFSDHPTSAWFGAWYVSEVLNILTDKPDVWKKTIFILCYDENDGYFDHVPPYQAPMPGRPETGKTSKGIDTSVDIANVHGRNNSIGLGYRVPLVVASPWSRGGCVNSQVFDHTSILQFLETWLGAKGKRVREDNISEWRRTICGDLTSVFRGYDTNADLTPLNRDEFVEGIYSAKFKVAPHGGNALSRAELATTDIGSFQEPGTRPSCPLPYDLSVNARRAQDKLVISFGAGKSVGNRKAHGAPFKACTSGSEMTVRNFAVRAGDTVEDEWQVIDTYFIRVDGPNGFMREFKGGADDPMVTIRVGNSGASVNVHVANQEQGALVVEVHDESYGQAPSRKTIPARGASTLPVEITATHGWYDFSVRIGHLAYRYAGRVETGKWTITDPAMA